MNSNVSSLEVLDHMYAFVAWQPKFEKTHICSTSGQGDQEVARVGRSATDYKINSCKTMGKWHLTMHLQLHVPFILPYNFTSCVIEPSGN